MLHVVAGEARIHSTTRRAALGDWMRGARSRLAGDASIGHHVHALVRGGREPLFDSRTGRALLRFSDRHPWQLQDERCYQRKWQHFEGMSHLTPKLRSAAASHLLMESFAPKLRLIN